MLNNDCKHIFALSQKVDEINPRGQFHQHFTCAFLPILLGQKIMKPKCNKEKLSKALLYEKRARKMLMKLTPGRNPTM